MADENHKELAEKLEAFAIKLDQTTDGSSLPGILHSKNVTLYDLYLLTVKNPNPSNVALFEAKVNSSRRIFERFGLASAIELIWFDERVKNNYAPFCASHGVTGLTPLYEISAPRIYYWAKIMEAETPGEAPATASRFLGCYKTYAEPYLNNLNRRRSTDFTKLLSFVQYYNAVVTRVLGNSNSNLPGVDNMPGAAQTPPTALITTGLAVLPEGNYLQSPSGQFQAVMQTDGNFVVYDYSDANDFGSPKFNTVTRGVGSAPYQFQLLQSGQIQVIANGNPSWTPKYSTANFPSPFRLEMQDDSNLVLYASNNSPMWGSNP